MKRIFLIFAMLALGLAACTQDDVSLNSSEIPIIESSKKAEDPANTKVSFYLAEKVARSTRTGTRAEGTVQDIKTLCSDNGEPMMYAVNFSNSDGFVLVSASQNYFPVLAEVESGSFNPFNIPDNVRFYLEGYKYAIEAYNSAPGDSVKKYQRLWKKYLEKESDLQKPVTRSSDPLLDAFIYDSQRQWNGQGYDWTSLAENRLGLDFFDDFVIEYTDSHPDADLETIFIVSLPVTDSGFTDNLITTSWGQGNPYNSLIPNQYPVGCVAVAMGQIMKFHEKPAGYRWWEMKDYYYENENASELAKLLRDIGTQVKMDYNKDGSKATIKNAQSALVRYGYKNATIINHNKYTIMGNLQRGKPVYGRGEDSQSGGHAWVYCGIDFREDTFYYYLLTPEKDPDSSSYFKYKWNQAEITGEIIKSWVYRWKHYINWGWYGSYNGWYEDHDISIKNNENKILYNFEKRKKDIYNIE